MQAADIVWQFADHLLIGLSAVQANSTGVARLAVGQPLTFETATGERTRSLVLPNVGTAKLHGRGCVIEFHTGADVDFDWDPEGREVFDGWRLGHFASSIGHGAPSEADLVLAARSDERLVETRPGWFALALLASV